MTEIKQSSDFLEYWESLGFFENIQMVLPRQFLQLFEIARLIASQDPNSKIRKAIDELSKIEKAESPEREQSILINRMERSAPLSDKMELQYYKTIYDLKKTLPRELAWDEKIFNIKLLTRTLYVQKFLETDTDNFKTASPTKNEKGQNIAKFEQKCYLLLDRSRSMEKRMRSFYSKSIVAEFLKRKLGSGAKLFYRAFDSKPGPLIKIEKKEEFPALIEEVIMTTRGGTSTNMQAAIFQAIDDINYDKEMTDAEILVVTDGLVHDLDIEQMREKLKGIKLNILKIGLDLAEPNAYEIEQHLAEAGYEFNPFSIRVKDIKEKLENAEEKNSLSITEQRIYEYMIECSDKIIKDIKEVSHKFIQIEDLNTSKLESISLNNLKVIEEAYDKLMNSNISSMNLHEQLILYKKLYFMDQYIEFLLSSDKTINKNLLQKMEDELFSFRQRMLNDPNLLEMIMNTKGFEDDAKATKMAKKHLRKKLKEENIQTKALSKETIKNAQMVFSMSGGSGSESGGLLIFYILFIKLKELLKRTIKKLFTHK